MANSALSIVPGGQQLVEWFGRVPTFQDAELIEIKLASNDVSSIRTRTWRITREVDQHGYFILDKHAAVSFILENVTRIELRHFNLPGIIHKLEATSVDNAFQIAWTGSYGVEGMLRAKQLRIELAPGH
jgi:hypothetical protein